MSSGYVTSVNYRPADITKSKRLGKSVNLSGLNPAYQFSVDDYLWANPITSFRSGPSYERAARKPGSVLSTQTLNEFLTTANGDLGHEFSMKKTTECYGSTFSRRPSFLMSPVWGQLTNPVPMALISPSSSRQFNMNEFTNRSQEQAIPDYGFAKSDAELVTLGTSFIKATNPIQSQVDLLSDIVEAFVDKALLPGLLGKSIFSSVIDPRKRRGIIHAVGGEYLNYIFGYKPLADDIAKTALLIDTVNGLVNQWIKDSGTIVRRRRRIEGTYKVVADKSLDNSSGGALAGSLIGAMVPGRFFGQNQPVTKGFSESTSNMVNVSSRGLMVSRVRSEINFSAGFEYDLHSMLLPVEGGSAVDLMTNAVLRGELTAIAFGLDPASISTALYDATPFSWLLDWFANIGDIFDNVRGLVSRGVQMLWGYVSETVTRDTYFEYAYTWVPTGEVFFRSNGFYAQKAIRRIRATPFGFGTSFDSLNTSQSATLAALLAAKSPSGSRRAR